MSKAGYVLVDAGILPEVYRKVLTAKKYLATGKAASVKEAAQLAGISRSAYYKYYTRRNWDNAQNYDLCLNSAELGFDKCVEIVEAYMNIRFK